MFVAWLVVAACRADSPVGPIVPLGEPFDLGVRSGVVVGDSGPGLEFLRVRGDSRCPIDAVCIQGGDAVVDLRASQGRRTEVLELHTGDASRASAVVGSLRVTLLDVHPYPFSGHPIAPSSYVATFRVTPAP